MGTGSMHPPPPPPPPPRSRASRKERRKCLLMWLRLDDVEVGADPLTEDLAPR